MNRRYEVLAFKIANEMEVMHLKEEIQGKVKERIDRHQKEVYIERAVESDSGRAWRGQYAFGCGGV